MLRRVATPEVSVVIPSHARPLRLRWLLNALEEQTLPRERFEVIVVHDYKSAQAAQILDRHPLRAEGVLSHVAIEPGTGNPSRQRNLGWREANAPLIAFTDDDCRPEPDWLESLLSAAHEHPGSVVQGATRPDPYETDNYAAPHHRSLYVDPPSSFAQTCNIAYPVTLLEAVGGFDESLPAAAGEDTDLAMRAETAGGSLVAAPGAVVFHAVEAYSLPEMVHLNRKWLHLPYVVARHPRLRGGFDLGLFWKRSHLQLYLALLGLLLSCRMPAALLLLLPYIRATIQRRGNTRRALFVGALELPGQLAVDSAEAITMLRGSIRYRSPVL